MASQGIESDLPEEIHRKVTEIGYRFGDELGRGAFGKAFRCHLVDANGVEGEEMAVKHMNLEILYTARYRDPKSTEDFEVIEEQKWRESDRLHTTKWRKLRAMLGIGNAFMVEATPNQAVIKSGEGVQNELLAMNRANHPNIVKLINVLTFEDTRVGSKMPHARHILIFMEIAKQDLLEYRLKFDKPLDEEEARNYSVQIARGLAHLHKEGIAHLDIKPQNILVSVSPGAPFGVMLKITDFGLALLFPLGHTGRTQWTRGGTFAYTDPDVHKMIECKKVGRFLPKQIKNVKEFDAYKADVWSYGVIVLEFFITVTRFFNMNNKIKDKIKDIYDSKFDAGTVYLEDLATVNPPALVTDLLVNIFGKTQTDRLSAAQCLEHDWLSSEVVMERSRAPSFSIHADDSGGASGEASGGNLYVDPTAGSSSAP